MHRTKVCASFLVAAALPAQQKTDQPGTTFLHFSMGFASQVTANATIAVEPPGPLTVFENMRLGTISDKGGDTYHRWVADDSKRGYFGYDISAEPLRNGDRIRVTIAPLSLSVDQLDAASKYKGFSGLQFLVLPRYPPPFTVKNGDTVALDLLVSADGKQKIVEYIEISYKSLGSPKR